MKYLDTGFSEKKMSSLQKLVKNSSKLAHLTKCQILNQYFLNSSCVYSSSSLNTVVNNSSLNTTTV